MRLHFALKQGLQQALGKVLYGCRKNFLRRTLPVGKNRIDVLIDRFLERRDFDFSTDGAFGFVVFIGLPRLWGSNYPLDTKFLTFSMLNTCRVVSLWSQKNIVVWL